MFLMFSVITHATFSFSSVIRTLIIHGIYKSGSADIRVFGHYESYVNSQINMLTNYSYLYLLKHARVMSLFNGGYFLVPIQLDSANVVGLKNAVNKFRINLVGDL